MSIIKKLSVLAIAVFALGAIGVANASAAQFTASETGEIQGVQLANQVFTVGGSTVTCKKAASHGTVSKLATPEITVTVTYTECETGGAAIDPIHALYIFTANGEVHIEENITIVVTSIFGTCHITVPKQTVGTVAYDNNGKNVKVTPSVTGIKAESSGFPCPSGTNGTYSGANEVHLVGGGTVSWDA